MRRQIFAITKKELSNYFGSPLALIFLGTFVAAVLFIFFTIETFFARGIADVRPLFQWMPILLIFLLAALTMRQWSEERRAGTEELLLTLPVSPAALVLGKFLAVMALILIALGLTLPLPITVALLGNLDWGPVIGGYLAAILLASAYAAIGLFVSSRTDNQIVALIVTVLLGGFFYAIGTRGITDFVGGAASKILWAIGTGSRFESIQRGVIDLRDLIYYGSLTTFFLMLNALSLDSIRWSRQQTAYRRKMWGTAVLVGLNLLLLNVWLYPLVQARLDITADQQYSLSSTTKDLINTLQEPLLIRAYISENNHPLLLPLIPQIQDMLREYEIASNGMITAEVVDPITNPELEAEANQTYGIQPTPFQVSGRYEASVINSYFDILVRYGDQDVVLNFQDLIQVEQTAVGPEVRLRNLEYDLTSAVKKAVYGFQSVDAVLGALDQPVTLTAYVTPDTLPPDLAAVQQTVDSVAQDIAAGSNGKFIYQVVNVDDSAGGVSQQSLYEQYGIQPIPTSLFSPDTFYDYLVLQNGDQVQVIPPQTDNSEGAVRTAIESALKRTSTGFLKTVGLWTPPADPSTQFGNGTDAASQYSQIRQLLGQDYTVRSVDLSGGQVPADIDMLLVIATQDMTEEEVYALDQYLMRGGSVVVMTNGYELAPDNFSGQIGLLPVNGRNLRDWLSSNGLTIEDGLVMDPQNQPFPVAVVRQVGGVQVQEYQALDYPFFVDVRPNAMDTQSPILANLPAVTMSWVSPVVVDEAKNADRSTSILMRSSDGSWLTTDTNIQPNFDLYTQYGFPISDTTQAYPLAVSVKGQFTSYFADKQSPLETAVPTPSSDYTAVQPNQATPYVSTITQSPNNARLVVIGSSAFPNDMVLSLSGALTQDRYLTNLQFVQNVVDWSVEDLDLLAIRAHGTTAHVLNPLSTQQEAVWEGANYVVALLALAGIFAAWRWRKRRHVPDLPSSTAPTVAAEGGK